jgi:hypothetical protein
MFVAVVADVADVALVALPDRAPEKVVAVRVAVLGLTDTAVAVLSAFAPVAAFEKTK